MQGQQNKGFQIRSQAYQYNSNMLKDQTVTNAFNLFSIVSYETHGPVSTISVDFTAPFNLNKTSNSIVPAFCHDRNYFTPAFILPREKEYYCRNSAFEKICFQERIRKVENLTQDQNQTSPQRRQLVMALPNTKFCQVCKTAFEEYYEHMKSQMHQSGIQSSAANNYIVQLCQNYKFTQKQVKKSQKHKQIAKNKREKPANNSNLAKIKVK